MQRDNFQYIWDNKCHIEVVKLSVGFVNNLSDQDTKVLEQCHHRGDFFGFAHEKCNWIRRTINFTPVIGNNITN